MAQQEKILDNVRRGINPVTMRKISKGPVGDTLRKVEEQYRQNPEGLFAPDCPSVIVDGKCLKDKRKAGAAIELLKTLKVGKKANTLPVAVAELEKKIRSAKDKKNPVIEKISADLMSVKKRAEVKEYLSKAEIKQLKKTINEMSAKYNVSKQNTQTLKDITRAEIAQKDADIKTLTGMLEQLMVAYERLQNEKNPSKI